MASWQIQDAKAKLSALIKRAQSDGPQTITRHGAEQAVIMSMEDFKALSQDQPSFVDHLLGGPKFDDFDVARDDDHGRPVEL